MQSIAIVILGIIGMMFGWFVYSKFIASRIFKLDDSFVTPAHTEQDGVDFVPTNKVVLWGHHFTSVAGAAPIVGPAIAVYWGWVPAVLWVVFGTILFAGVHDMGALWASSRHKGKSMGALSESVIGKRSRSLFMIVIFLVLLMVNAVFGVVIANSFVSQPNAVFPAWMAIAVALVIGQLLKRNFALVPLCLVGIAVLYASVYFGSYIPISLPETMFGLADKANWIIILFVYAAIASLLPVWMLLQPRDFINGMQLLVGLFLLYGAVFFSLPDITAPAFNTQTAIDSPSLIPLLFVTIACGAVSGFHGIVASGTSSKQLDKETDARFVGYLGAIGEGSLALITIVAVSGVAFAASPEEWHEVYSHLGAGSVGAFITGGANLIQQGWGLPVDFSSTILAVMVVLFAGTTMDSGVRLQRYIIQEWGDIYAINLLKNGVVATLLAVGCCLLLAFGAGGASGSGGMIIWPLFGSTNQILASLTLLVISVMLIKLGRPAKYTLIPMVFVLVMAFFAGLIKLKEYYLAENYLLVFLDAVVLVVSVLVMLEAFSVVSKLKKDEKRESLESEG
ncbi:carbon starvation protein CstA [Alteromonas australica]|jgi:carbon starvation protein|uniref:Carbon starvation protein A n=1 Tax=Alteromonas australica TaxID=589873 RepID=A0A075P386_9ALTE|nr:MULTISPECIES: carbon starvation protein A [Alteromonas]AJG38106.1 carbon starvation protein CstA [uncultured Gammaproteobacteria bacterium]MAF70367.1 carbon starvation protein A [Alteromonas sp.]AIG00277.1 carbon starvation protein CstA [Alteromonas australica]AJP45234.1 carbon starvation protein CstA [Alteromonas australica]MBU33249.1 carbon starvation protein A [Alteromonas sp.]|tara:strand:- start:682 stop:2373 length:1692 start_codon:yes stop_codon:yes gene_type:complete